MNLHKLNKDILSTCISISESISNADELHLQLNESLSHMSKQFNKLCQYLRVRESYEYLL